jgi:NAD(P)-dependent dehydrogenase (short-subunit alcohol dehydrogenase family)
MYKPFDLSGKVALITGGNGGIGFGMAEALAQAGADIAIWGTNRAKNADAEEALKRCGCRVISRAVDVTSESAVAAAMGETVETMGRVDTCIANAGLSRRCGFLDITEDDYRRVMAVNMDGAFWTMREACRHMKGRAERGDPGGSIVCVSSLGARFGTAFNSHYGCAKTGIIGVVRAIAVEFARYGIRANAVLPGWTATDMTKHLQQSDTFKAEVMPRIPLRRWGQPADFGGIAVYLASDASSYHTGDSILIDGGYAVF